MPPLIDHSQDARRSRGMPPLTIAWLIVLALAAGVGSVLFVQSLTRHTYATDTISGFHSQDGLTFVHLGITQDVLGDQTLAALIFESGAGEKLTPITQLQPEPRRKNLLEIPAFTLFGGKVGEHTLRPDQQQHNIYKFEDHDLVPLDFSVTLPQWRAYESRYREIGNGDLAAENLKLFLQQNAP